MPDRPAASPLNSHSDSPTPAHTLHRVVQVDIRRTLRQTLLIGLVFTVLLATPVAIQQRADARNLASLRQADQERVIKVAAQIIHQEFDAVIDAIDSTRHKALLLACCREGWRMRPPDTPTKSSREWIAPYAIPSWP